MTGCTVAAPPPSPTPIPVVLPPVFAADAAQALPALVAAERAAARRGDAALLALLWAEEATVRDGRGTADPADDYHWRGRAAILDRYRLAVFPSPPPPLPDSALSGAVPQVHGDTATLTVNGDRWRFVRRDGRWWLLELAYSLEPS